MFIIQDSEQAIFNSRLLCLSNSEFYLADMLGGRLQIISLPFLKIPQDESFPLLLKTHLKGGIMSGSGMTEIKQIFAAQVYPVKKQRSSHEMIILMGH